MRFLIRFYGYKDKLKEEKVGKWTYQSIVPYITNHNDNFVWKHINLMCFNKSNVFNTTPNKLTSHQNISNQYQKWTKPNKIWFPRDEHCRQHDTIYKLVLSRQSKATTLQLWFNTSQLILLRRLFIGSQKI